VSQFAAKATDVYNSRMRNHVSMRVLPFLPVGAALCLAPAPIVAQSPASAPSLTIKSIVVSGQARFSGDQVLATIGWKAGQDFDVKALNRAAEILGKSGAFEEVSYTYTPHGNQVTVEFTVKEVAKFRKCIFDNFVWASDEELQARLQKDIPLYTGEAPETGTILDDISRDLEKLSQERGVTARVERRVQQASIVDPNWNHLYVAQGPQVKMQAVSFSGMLAASPKELEKDAGVLAGKDYSRARCLSFATAVLMPFYHERGYLRATANLTARVLSHAPGSNEFAVEAIYTVNEGRAYRWAAPEWKGNQRFAEADLESLTGMKAESTANEQKIEEGWAAVKKAYAKNGYFEAKITTEQVLDEAGGHVHYVVTASEGPQYRMGNFEVFGVPPKVADRLKGKWRLKTGYVFDGSYMSEFLKKDAAAALAGALQPSSKVKISTQPNQEQHVVDVTFQVQ